MAEDLTIMCSGAFFGALHALLPLLRSEVAARLAVVPGSSKAAGPRAIPVRLRAGEAADLVILFEDAIDALADEGLILPDTKATLATSGIGIAVRRDAIRPDVSTSAALRDVLLRVGSFAYSSSASGDHVSGELIRKLGLPGDVMRRGVRVDGEPVGAVVARGGADLGFQQMSELVSVEGIALLGPLPDDVQKTTVLAAAVSAGSRNASSANLLIGSLTLVRTHRFLVEAGLRPATPSRAPGHAVAAARTSRRGVE